ncbi:abortive infection family protein [Paracoccus haeundaensis]|nr:abortive infection family protein [Paracoccus haeundaensis]
MTARPVDWEALRDQCAEVLWHEVSAPQLPNVCRRIGLDPEQTQAEPMNSKRAYVKSLLGALDDKATLAVARRIVENYDDFQLREAVNKIDEVGQSQVSEITRRKLVELFDDIDISGSIDLGEFLNELWPLSAMDSSGKHHQGAVLYGSLEREVYQHCIHYSDWSNSYLLKTLGLLHCSNALLFRFFEMCVHPRTRDEQAQRRIAKQITEVLRRDGFALAEVKVQSGYPIFGVVTTAALGRSPASQDVSAVLASFDEDSVHAAWQKAIARKNIDPEGAITSARTLLETVCKHILDEQGIEYQMTDDLPKLWHKCAESLNLAPSQHTLEPFKQVLGGCASVVQGLGTVRNRIGDAHGQGRSPVRPKPRHAALAVDLAGAMATFLVATYNEKRKV